MRVMILGLVAASLSATVPAAVPAPVPADNSPQGVSPLPRCTQAVLAKYIGKHKSRTVARRMRHATGAKSVRWVPVGMMVNMIYQRDRLTVRLGPDHHITQASCN